MTKPRFGDRVTVRSFDGIVKHVNENGTLDVTPRDGGRGANSVDYIPPGLCILTDRVLVVGDTLATDEPEPPIGTVVTTETVDGVIVWLRTANAKWCSDGSATEHTWTQVVLDADLITVVHAPPRTTERKPAE